ncbi:MAG: lysozyme inhibitor LprI family protein [Phenylobacterium sp.]
MPVDRYGEPLLGATYNGFSGAPPAGEDPRRTAAAPAPMRRSSRNTMIVGGIAAAAVLGLALGFAFKPDQRSYSTGAEEAAVTPKVPIQVNAPPPVPLPKPAGKLEVLPAGAAEAARPAWSAAPPPAQPAPPVVSSAPISPRIAEPERPPVTVAPAPLSQPPPARVEARAEPCAARSRAEALICADAGLAAYDRDLNRAYRRAMRSGAVSPDDLRADQRDWLADREDAARRSPRALGDLYERRIDELNRIADDGPGD